MYKRQVLKGIYETRQEVNDFKKALQRTCQATCGQTSSANELKIVIGIQSADRFIQKRNAIRRTFGSDGRLIVRFLMDSLCVSLRPCLILKLVQQQTILA